MIKDGFILRNDKRVNLFFCLGEVDFKIVLYEYWKWFDIKNIYL